MLTLKDIEKIFIGKFDIQDFKILKKNNEYGKMYIEYKKLPLSKDLILAVKGNIELKKLIILRNFLEEYLEKKELVSSLIKKLEILEREFLSLSTINQFIIYSEFEKEFLEKFFLLIGEKFKYAFIKNDKVLINTGINNNCLKIIKNKLRKTDRLSFSYLSGEVFAIKSNFLSLIIYSSNKKIEDFYKELVEVKLFLLRNIFIYLGEYSVDELTGFYSKKKLFIDIKYIKDKIALILNIRNFNYINNIFGISFGDKVLKEFAAVLRDSLSKNKYIYRITGDKFLILFDNFEEAKRFFFLLDKTLQSGINLFHDTTQEFVVLNLPVQGIILKNLTEQFVDNAVVYLKKEHFHNKNLIIFEEEILPLLERDLESLKIVQNAIAENAILPVFQKILGLKEEDYYYEALMRIKLNDKIYNPGQFLEIAKEKGLYPKLSNILLNKALTSVKDLKTKVSINVEISDILRKDFVKKIINTVDNLKIPREGIVFEITESEYMGNYFNEVKEIIFKLKNAGFLIAIDDFGSGYSNFQSLTEIPIDMIKIDGSLIKDITKNEKLKYIVSSIVSMARLLDIKTVAEFVSSEEIYEEVLKLDIDYAQGFFIDKPKFLEDILEEHPELG